MNRSGSFARVFVIGLVSLVALAAGCISVGAPPEISVNTDVGRREHVDTSSVPPTRDHEEARQRLAEAYSEIRSLRSKVDKLERDKKDLKRERDGFKQERDDCRKETKATQKYEKKQRKENGNSSY
jgi:TolA-binding protein